MALWVHGLGLRGRSLGPSVDAEAGGPENPVSQRTRWVAHRFIHPELRRRSGGDTNSTRAGGPIRAASETRPSGSVAVQPIPADSRGIAAGEADPSAGSVARQGNTSAVRRGPDRAATLEWERVAHRFIHPELRRRSGGDTNSTRAGGPIRAASETRPSGSVAVQPIPADSRGIAAGEADLSAGSVARQGNGSSELLVPSRDDHRLPTSGTSSGRCLGMP